MAPRSNTSYIILALFSLLAIFSRSSKAYGHLQLKETNLSLYIHDHFGTNGTVVIVAGIAGQAWSFFSFGTLFVMDDPITIGPNKDSPQIGWAQGISIISSPDAVYNFLTISLVFTNQEYNGTTLELQGRVFNLATPGQTLGEVAVVGGTGKFRFASGFAMLDFVSYDATLAYSLFRINITILHY